MGSKKYHDPEWLREKYHGEVMTLKEIGELCGVSRPTISDWLDRHGIDKRTQKETQRLRNAGKHSDREWLAEQYHGKGRTLKDIAAECDVDAVTIMNWMERHEIPRRDAPQHKREEPANHIFAPSGYERVASKIDGKFKQAKVHQLIAIANGANPHKLFGGDYHVHHKNGVKWDNRPENLEVLTQEAHDKLHAAERDRAATGEWL
jgi:transposase